MTVLIGTILISTTGWIFSLACPRSAVRRHFILTTALVACLILPLVLQVRSGTDWTLLELADSRLNEIQPADAGRQYEPVSVDDSSSPLTDADEIDAESTRSAEPEEAASLPALTPAERLLSQAANEPAQKRFAAATRVDFWEKATFWGVRVYALVACAMLVRLLVSFIVLHRVKRRGVELGMAHNGIRVLEAEVQVPLAVGFGKPAIVLPRGLRETMPPDELQDVLDHEAEHLLRRDHWIILLQGISTAAYWLIVTVHLLNRALCRAREELCDNAVLAGRDAAAYGQTLLSVGERVLERHSLLVPLASSIIRRGELERRVIGVLDTRRDRRTRLSQRLRGIVMLSLLGLALLAGTTRVVAVPKPSAEQSNTDDAKTVEALLPDMQIKWTDKPRVDLENPTLHRGIVVGPEGKPLAGAKIYAASTIELLERGDKNKVGVAALGPLRAVTDEQGRFEFHANDLTGVTPDGKRKRWETFLLATKEGGVPGWLKTWGADRNLRSHWHPQPKREVVIQTRPPETLTGRFLLEGGKPLVGARVRLTGLMAPVEYDLDVHIPKEEQNEQGMFSTVDYAETLYRPDLLPGVKTETTTDQEGGFSLPGLPEGFIAQLEVTHPQAVTTTLRAAVRPMPPVFRAPFLGRGESVLSLYGSGFTATLAKGVVLRGQVTSRKGLAGTKTKAAAGVTVARANHNARSGMTGQQFKTDAEGRFVVTGLRPSSKGYTLAFSGSFDAPYADTRRRVAPGEDARVQLSPAVPYRLKLVDPQGKPVDREVYSIRVQTSPGTSYRGIKSRFNTARRVAPGIYEGIVPWGPAAVLVQRGAKTDRPAAVDPKAFFEPGRTDWTREEERYAYGDAWGIAEPAIIETEQLSAVKNPRVDQLDLAAVVLTNAKEFAGVQELTATVYTDPPVELTLVDTDNRPVTGADVRRQLKRYNEKELPATFLVYGLHPERAEFLRFFQPERGLIGTLAAKWTGGPVQVVMQPAATLIGRFTDKQGALNFDFGMRLQGEGIPPDTFVAGRVFKTTKEPGKGKGELNLQVPPGLEVRGEFVRKKTDRFIRPSVGTAFGPLVPEPGETIDLGNLIVP